jgi:hypothetical protein
MAETMTAARQQADQAGPSRIDAKPGVVPNWRASMAAGPMGVGSAAMKSGMTQPAELGAPTPLGRGQAGVGSATGAAAAPGIGRRIAAVRLGPSLAPADVTVLDSQATSASNAVVRNACHIIVAPHISGAQCTGRATDWAIAFLIAYAATGGLPPLHENQRLSFESVRHSPLARFWAKQGHPSANLGARGHAGVVDGATSLGGVECGLSCNEQH